jgi:threonine dehydratase
MVTLEEVQAAAARVAPILRQTALTHVHSVSTAVGREVWIKQEQLQRTGSYKIRGAYNFISQLAPGIRVVAASAGNHAQGVALASKLTNHVADIYMPRRASLPKIEATEGYGANITLINGDLEDCVRAARAQCESDGSTFVPPFDHPHVIAGQGTLGLELARDLPDHIEAVVVPVGGGGLISGVATALKALRPSIKVIGVEATGAPTMTRSIREGRPVRLDQTATMADGIAMREVSELTLEHVQHYVDNLVLVTEEEMSHALLLLLERAKAVVEPGAATSLAAIMAGEVPGNGAVCTVLSGGNVDPVLLMNLIDHGLTASGRYFAVRIVIADAPGALASITTMVADMGMNIIDIEHHRSGHHLEAAKVEIIITLETRDRRQQELFLRALEDQGMTAELED